jgi:3-isopropylmalate/(R)-2-methylmalate dehydratase small subunit
VSKPPLTKAILVTRLFLQTAGFDTPRQNHAGLLNQRSIYERENMPTILTGIAHVYNVDNIDTDRIIPGKYTKTLDMSELAAHVLEDLDPAFSKTVSVGDVLVAGNNFGCGSSREQAPLALKAAGVSAVVARSFARIFFRNAINIGLLVVEAPEHQISNGAQVSIDIENGIIESDGKQYRATKMPDVMMKILNAGGLVNFLNQAGGYK